MLEPPPPESVHNDYYPPDAPLTSIMFHSPSLTVPVVTTSPTPCCSVATNEVIFRLSTIVTIPDYHRFYSSPIDSFSPTYYALPDGSLFTPPYTHDLMGAYKNLIFLSVLTIVFFRNILVSGDYIRRGKVKKKGLFYLLFASQILGPVALLPLLIAYFHDSIDCTV
jgi:hypothetical protein